MQLDQSDYFALSLGRSEEESLCGVIFTDRAYPLDAALAVIRKMLEDMMAHVPNARYQHATTQMAAPRPAGSAPVRNRANSTHANSTRARAARSCNPAQPHSGQPDIDEPVLVAAAEFPAMQDTLKQYQDVNLAQRLATRHLETSTSGSKTLGVPLDLSPTKKRSFLGMARKRRSPRSERPATDLNIRTLSRTSSETSNKALPATAAAAPASSVWASKKGNFTILSPNMLRGRPSDTRSGHYSPGTVEAPSLAPSPRKVEDERTISRQSTVETLRREAVVIDGGSTPVAGTPRRSTLSGLVSEPARSPQPSLPLSGSDNATRIRSATVTTGAEPPAPLPAGSALLNHPRQDLTTGCSHRSPSLVNSEAGGNGRHATVQASLNSVRSLSRSTVSVHSGDDDDADETDTETETDAPSDARTPSPLASFSAVRAALALSPTADPKRADRIRERSTWNPNPEEVIAPMIVEKRVDFLPNLAMEEPEPEPEPTRVTDRIIPRVPTPFKTSRMQLKGRRHHTVQPHIPTPPDEKGSMLSAPTTSLTPASSSHSSGIMATRASLGQYENQHHMTHSNSALVPSSPRKASPVNFMAAQPTLHVSHSVGTTGGMRLLPSRRRAMTSTEAEQRDDGCVVM